MNTTAPLTEEALVAELMSIGEELYHHKHPFHIRMHEGSLQATEIRCWIKNRFYYQSILPIKDAIVLSKLTHSIDRRLWVKRILDQDGEQEGSGGIEAWLLLGEGAGIEPDQLLDLESVAPSVKQAVDSYVDFCHQRSWLPAVASSLTELFAPKLIAYRLDVFKKHYGWIKPAALEYFFNRLHQAPRDCNHALTLVRSNAVSCEQQQQVIEALRFKCGLLWRMLDGIESQCKAEVLLK
jgi:pyrroloquinoline-quinone synthase